MREFLILAIALPIGFVIGRASAPKPTADELPALTSQPSTQRQPTKQLPRVIYQGPMQQCPNGQCPNPQQWNFGPSQFEMFPPNIRP